MVNGKELARAGCPMLGTPYSTMDCQAFIEACLKACGNSTNLAGSNAWLRRIASEGWIGTPQECRDKFGEIPVGAFLFIREFDGKEPAKYQGDGFGNASHIGLYTGMTGQEMVDIAVSAGDTRAVNYNFGDGAIHSSSSRGHVATSKFAGKAISGGWNIIGLWRAVDYGERINAILNGGDAPDPGPDPGPEPTPEPEPEIARVWSPNGKPVNTRKGPDESYALSKAGKIPAGALVDILSEKTNKQGEQWARISWQDQRAAVWHCWIKREFLRPVESPPEVTLYTVTIPYLTEYAAEALIQRYPGAWKTEQKG